MPFGILTLEPSLSMKKLSINNFTIKLLSKLFRNLSIGDLVFDTKKFGSKVSTIFSYEKLSFYEKMSINNFTTKLLSTF